MANFELCSDIDIDPSEYIDSCSTSELRELVDILKEEYPELFYVKDNQNLNDKMFSELLSKLSKNRLFLSNEEIEFITKIANKF